MFLNHCVFIYQECTREGRNKDTVEGGQNHRLLPWAGSLAPEEGSVHPPCTVGQGAEPLTKVHQGADSWPGREHPEGGSTTHLTCREWSQRRHTAGRQKFQITEGSWSDWTESRKVSMRREPRKGEIQFWLADTKPLLGSTQRN